MFWANPIWISHKCFCDTLDVVGRKIQLIVMGQYQSFFVNKSKDPRVWKLCGIVFHLKTFLFGSSFFATKIKLLEKHIDTTPETYGETLAPNTKKNLTIVFLLSLNIYLYIFSLRPRGHIG